MRKILGAIIIFLIAYTINVGLSSVSADSFIDIGFRISQKIDAETNEIVAIAAEPSGTNTSPLKISKNGSVYGLALVDPTDIAATKALVKLASGQIKALRKFTVTAIPTHNFQDQSGDATGYCSAQGTVFYANITITNPLNSTVSFTRTAIDAYGKETAPQSFTIPALSTIVKGGFGYLGPYPSCNTVTPEGYYANSGSADYEIRQNGTLIDTVKYSWYYAI